MSYEIEFLPVGNGDSSGDAILVRYKENEKYVIMVIDGGTQESGEAIVNHIKEYYETDYVDYVVNTHPDQDHASGLSVVLDKLQVGELWIHRP
ncbi:MAG: MBL fold metallo-hydrolase [Campylobacteraceae bacterium]